MTKCVKDVIMEDSQFILRGTTLQLVMSLTDSNLNVWELIIIASIIAAVTHNCICLAHQKMGTGRDASGAT
jgi:hypothetical protein